MKITHFLYTCTPLSFSSSCFLLHHLVVVFPMSCVLSQILFLTKQIFSSPFSSSLPFIIYHLLRAFLPPPDPPPLRFFSSSSPLSQILILTWQIFPPYFLPPPDSPHLRFFPSSSLLSQILILTWYIIPSTFSSSMPFIIYHLLSFFFHL